MNEDNETPAAESVPAEPTQKRPSLLRNYVSFIGLALSAASLTSIGLLVLIELSSGDDNPYTVLVTYILLPSVLGFGIVVVLLGMLLERRRRRRDPEAHITPYPVLDLNDPIRRRRVLLLLGLSFIFLFLSAFGSYRAFEYTESVAFCGQQCHAVMKPEFVAYNAAAHSRIRCVECHVGGGPEWYVRSKINGMHQLYAVTFNTYNRPIQTPLHNMRPADETCSKCHSPEKYFGEQLKVFNHFGYDETNSLNQTQMLIKTGGGSPNAGQVGGIHWHMNVANEITYIASDEKRQDISWVRLKDRTGKVTEFMSRNASLSSSDIEQAPQRRMDCIDCHNRPTHVYLSPNEAVDRSLTAGRLDVALPFVKAQAVAALSAPYATNDEALITIENSLMNFYRMSYPDIFATRNDSVTAAVAEVKQIYQTYFFPEMKTDWKAHINNLGHLNAQGCFRCHDGQHVSSEGRVIRNDCSICHTTVKQSFGGRVFQPTDGVFQHPVDLGDKNTWQCAACHKADRAFKHPLNLGDISKFKCSECHTGGFDRVQY